MNHHEQSWLNRHKIRKEANNHVGSHVELLLEGHPYRNDLLKCLGSFKNDDSMTFLISFLGNADQQHNEVLKSIDTSHKESYVTLNERMKEIDERLDILVNYHMKEVYEINDNLTYLLKIQKAVYSKLNRKTKWRRIMDWFGKIFNG